MQDAILRYGGIYTVALAYAGTGNNKAVRRLLHVAVSDVNDDVRRAAVTSLGFLLFRNPTQVPRIVELLSESYNPHVRYGSTLALGIACAGTGLDEAVDLLEPMLKDPVDFVRQGACISLAMVLIQQNETLNPRVGAVRKALEKVISDKHEDAMAKFGAALAQGLIDAGGRNVTISLQSRGGSSNMPAIVGMALFTQFWYWFPLAHFASLALTPTALVGLNRELQIPQFEFVSHARPSLFAYPAPVKPPTEKKVEKVETAVLSTTAKAQARQRTKEKEKAAAEGEVMETDEKPAEASKDDDAMKTDDEPAKAGGEGEGKAKSKRERKAEPTSETLPNYSRVTPAQLKYVTFPTDARFVPIRPVQGASGGAQHDVHNTSTVAGRLLGTATPAPGASGAVTPSSPANAGGGAKAQPRASGNGKPSAPPTASAESARTILSSSAGGGGGILLLVDRRPNEPFTPLALEETVAADEVSAEDAAAIAAAATAPDEPEQGQRETTGVAGAGASGASGDATGGPAQGGSGPEAR